MEGDIVWSGLKSGGSSNSEEAYLRCLEINTSLVALAIPMNSDHSYIVVQQRKAQVQKSELALGMHNDAL
jgi:hypothetical protein